MLILEIAGQLSGFRCRFIKVNDKGSLPEIARYGICYLSLNVFTASKGSKFNSLFCVFVSRQSLLPTDRHPDYCLTALD